MKRISLLLVIVVLLALVAGSVSAAPPAPVKGGGADWVNICVDPDVLTVSVKGDNVLVYECGTDWAKLCDKKAVTGYTDSEGPGILVQCGGF